MARKSKQDIAKAKAAKQKKILIVGSILFVAIAAIQLPKTLKMLNKGPKPPIVSAVGTTTDPNAAATGAPTDPNSVAAPTLAGAPTTGVAATPTAAASSSDLVSAVPVSADTGQLQTFERFATKDPFAQQASTGGTSSPSSGGSSSSGGSTSSGGSSSSGGSGVTVTTSAPPPSSPGGSAPSAPAPTSAVISVNGEAGSVQVGSDFPTSGTVFSRVGAIFHLVSLTAKSAKVAIAGGSYASGAQTIPLTMGKPLTLQNTADGTKYTLVLEPATTPVAAPVAGTTTTPSSTSTPLVPSSGTGG